MMAGPTTTGGCLGGSEAGENPALSRNCEAPPVGDEPGRLSSRATMKVSDEDGNVGSGKATGLFILLTEDVFV
jgi:hypothetical protein